MKKVLSRVVTTLLTVCLAIGLLTFTACGVTVELSETEVSLQVGKSITLTATVSDGSEVTWTSSDETVVTVDGGKLTGKKAGKATVTATCGGVSVSCNVTVTEAVTVTISDTTAALKVGETKQLTATASDGGAVTWKSADASIATVSDSGLVTAVGGGEVTISATSSSGTRATCSVTVTDPTKIPITMTGESGINDVLDTWFYFNEYAEVSEASYNSVTEKATFKFTNNAGNWYNLQMYYDVADLPEVEDNEGYGVKFSLNTTKAGHITVNQNVVEVKEGDNEIQVDNLFGGVGIVYLNIVIGKNTGTTIDIDAATMVFGKPVFEKYTKAKLKAPSAVAIDPTTKAVTVTCEDDDKASGYTLVLKKDGARDQSISIANGDVIDDSLIVDGEYKVFITTAGQGRYLNSDQIDTGVVLTVNHGPIKYDITHSIESEIKVGRFYYWCEHEEVKAEETKFDDGNATISWANHASNWYGVQVFYRDGTVEFGKFYNISFKLHSSAAGHITVNGKTIEIVEGDNTVTVDRIGSGVATLSIQMGVNGQSIDMGAAVITISDYELIELEVNPNDYTLAFGQVADDEWGNKGLPANGRFYYWNDQNWAGASVEVTEATYKNGTMKFTYEFKAGATDFGAQLFCKDTSLEKGATYTLTLKINATKATKVTINGTAKELVAGDNDVEVEFTAAEYTQPKGDCSFSMQIKGAEGEGANTLTISAITYTKK